MSVLVLLNGPPAAGKSTVATRLVAKRPLALNLDLDLIRGLLGQWLDRPDAAGQATRDLAEAMARTHLGSGHPVIVPQLLARTAFIERLEAVAVDLGVPFVELVLDLPRDEAIAALEHRNTAQEHQTHVDAAALMTRTGETPASIFDRLERLVASRPSAVRVPVIRGDIDATVLAVTSAIGRFGLVW